MSQWIANCEVVNAGPNSENASVEILLKQRDGDPFRERWFIAAANSKTEILATALAAIAAGKLVNIELEAVTEFSNITKLLMTKFSV